MLHSSMLKYAEKRRHFTYVTMQARLQLSIIDHNHNVGRQHDRTQSGEYANRNTHTQTQLRKEMIPLQNYLFIIIILLPI